MYNQFRNKIGYRILALILTVMMAFPSSSLQALASPLDTSMEYEQDELNLIEETDNEKSEEELIEVEAGDEETNLSHQHEFMDGVCECGEVEAHEHEFVDGICECGEVEAHEHEFVDGICECGASETDKALTLEELTANKSIDQVITVKQLPSCALYEPQIDEYPFMSILAGLKIEINDSDSAEAIILDPKQEIFDEYLNVYVIKEDESLTENGLDALTLLSCLSNTPVKAGERYNIVLNLINTDEYYRIPGYSFEVVDLKQLCNTKIEFGTTYNLKKNVTTITYGEGKSYSARTDIQVYAIDVTLGDFYTFVISNNPSINIKWYTDSDYREAMDKILWDTQGNGTFSYRAQQDGTVYAVIENNQDDVTLKADVNNIKEIRISESANLDFYSCIDATKDVYEKIPFDLYMMDGTVIKDIDSIYDVTDDLCLDKSSLREKTDTLDEEGFYAREPEYVGENNKYLAPGEYYIQWGQTLPNTWITGQYKVYTADRPIVVHDPSEMPKIDRENQFFPAKMENYTRIKQWYAIDLEADKRYHLEFSLYEGNYIGYDNTISLYNFDKEQKKFELLDTCHYDSITASYIAVDTPGTYYIAVETNTPFYLKVTEGPKITSIQYADGTKNEFYEILDVSKNYIASNLVRNFMYEIKYNDNTTKEDQGYYLDYEGIRYDHTPYVLIDGKYVIYNQQELTGNDKLYIRFYWESGEFYAPYIVKSCDSLPELELEKHYRYIATLRDRETPPADGYVYYKCYLKAGKSYFVCCKSDDYSDLDNGDDYFYPMVHMSLYSDNGNYYEQYGNENLVYRYTPESDGWYYIKMYSNIAGEIWVEQAPKIVDVKVIKKPICTTEYQLFSYTYGNIAGMELELTLEDMEDSSKTTTKRITYSSDSNSEWGHYVSDWPSYIDANYDPKTSPGKVYGYMLEPGQYKLLLNVKDFDTHYVVDDCIITVLPLTDESVQTIEVGQTYELPKNVERNRVEESNSWLYGKRNLFAMQVEEGKRYTPDVVIESSNGEYNMSEVTWFYYYNQGESSNLTSTYERNFIAPYTGLVYLSIYNSSSRATFNVRCGGAITDMKLTKDISATSYMIPDKYPYVYDGDMELTVTLEDGTKQTYKVDNSFYNNEFGIEGRVVSSSGEIFYEGGRLPSGTYYYEFKVNGSNDDSLKVRSKAFTVSYPSGVNPITVGKTITVAKNGSLGEYYYYPEGNYLIRDWNGKTNYYSVQLVKGEEYLFHFNSKDGVYEYVLYDANYTNSTYRPGRLKCEKTGTYYFGIKTEKQVSFTIEKAAPITNIRLTKRPQNNVFYVSERGVDSVMDRYYVGPKGLEVEVTYSDGSVERVEYQNSSDSEWEQSGMQIYYSEKQGDEWSDPDLYRYQFERGTYKWIVGNNCYDELIEVGEFTLENATLGLESPVELPCSAQMSLYGNQEFYNIYNYHWIKLDVTPGSRYLINSSDKVMMDLFAFHEENDAIYRSSINHYSGTSCVLEVPKEAEFWNPSMEDYETILIDNSYDAETGDRGADSFYIRCYSVADATMQLEALEQIYNQVIVYPSLEDCQNGAPITEASLPFVYGAQRPCFDGVTLVVSNVDDSTSKYIRLRCNPDVEDTITGMQHQLVECDATGNPLKDAQGNEIVQDITVRLAMKDSVGRWTTIYPNEKDNLSIGTYSWVVELPYAYEVGGRISTLNVQVPFKVIGAEANYTINYDGNEVAVQKALGQIATNARLKGKVRSQICKKNTYINLNANAFSYGGYKFVGWSTKPLRVYDAEESMEDILADAEENTANVYADREPVMNLSITGEDVTLYAIWQTQNYTITYHLGIDMEPEDCWEKTYQIGMAEAITLPTSISTAEDDIYKLGSSTYNGYIFSGWYSSTAYSGEDMKQILPGSYGNLDLYAKWIADSVSIQFVPTSGVTGTMSDQIVYYGQNMLLPLNNYKKMGSGFVGWSTEQPTASMTDAQLDALVKDKGFVDGANINIEAILKADTDPIKSAIQLMNGKKVLKLYPVWKANFTISYTVNTIVDRGTQSSYPDVTKDANYIESYAYGTSYALPTPSMIGYKFAGWHKDSSNGEKIDAITKETSGNLNLFAKWEPSRCTIRFDANGGIGQMNSVYTEYDKTYSLPGNTYTRPGYRFIGWVDENSKVLRSDAILTDAKNHTMSEQDILENLSSRYAEYHFYGEREVDGVRYGEQVKNLTTEDASLILYAVWAYDGYTYTLQTNGGTIAKYETLGLHIDGENLYRGEYTYSGFAINATVLPDAEQITKTGYVFDGWYTEPEFQNKVTTTNKMTGDVTLYAKWGVEQFDIEYDKNDEQAQGTMTSQTVAYGKTAVLKTNGFTNAGKVFGGWALSADSDVIVYKNAATITTPDLSAFKVDETNNRFVYKLYAVWYTPANSSSGMAATTFNIRYKNKDGQYLSEDLMNSAGESYPSSYVYGLGAYGLPNPVKDGYIFDGWYTDANYTKRVDVVDKNSIGDIELYAKFVGRDYTLILNPNAPQGTVASGIGAKMSMTYGSMKALTRNPYRVNGYTLVGWSFSPVDPIVDKVTLEEAEKDSRVVYTNGQKVSLDGTDGQEASEYYAMRIMYAVWMKDAYHINYVLNGVGSLPEGAVNAYVFSDTAIPLPEPFQKGYTFKGWYADANFRRKVLEIPAGSTGSKTYYAKWELNQ